MSAGSRALGARSDATDVDHSAYWEDFYSQKAALVPSEPSPFARWVAGREPVGTLLDIGSGTGRDSLYFASEGYRVLGCDYAVPGLRYAEEQARQRDLGDVAFQRLDLYDAEHALESAEAIARSTAPTVVYARFMVHALSDEGRHNLFLLSSKVLQAPQGRLYLEFRTARAEHEFGEHFRQFVQPDQVKSELGSHGFAIDHCEEGHGLAVHKSEDPRVCRIVADMRG